MDLTDSKKGGTEILGRFLSPWLQYHIGKSVIEIDVCHSYHSPTRDLYYAFVTTNEVFISKHRSKTDRDLKCWENLSF